MTPTRLPLFQVDAFTHRLFSGNPAAVCPLPAWLPDELLQSIAAENNLSETAFFMAVDNIYELRWFTPAAEVKLCGHATLASAYVLFECLGHAQDTIRFQTRHSGELQVSRQGSMLWLDFPAQASEPVHELPEELTAGFGAQPQQWRVGPNYMGVFNSESEVAALAPDMRALAQLSDRCVIATAPADDPEVDFISRYFAPNHGVDEDPVTGSAHCMLAPYWGARLGKNTLRARQISARGGELQCELAGERVRIGGQAQLYMTGEIQLPDDHNG